MSDFVFQDSDLSAAQAQATLDDALKGADDGELYVERGISESLTFDDGRLKNASFDTSRGFGLRCVAGETSGFAQSTELTPGALTRAARAVVMAKDGHSGNGRRESGFAGAGGRNAYDDFINPERWQAMAKESLRQALVNLDAVPAPAGQMDVVLGPGWPGILLHEAIGHGLEGDFIRKGTSAFSGMLGERVAAPGVTIVDDGTLAGRRGSLTIDDEGTPTSRTTLIEDGILKGFMQDRMNSRLLGVAATGNGRRESFAHAPMPRMTNTLMLGGDKDPAEILADLKDGIYATNFGGGQVDITSGKFVFQCTEAYKVKNGKIGEPVKGATLIGDGPTVLTQIRHLGNDMEIDPGIGVCGKAGQGVPVGVGQPSVYIENLTVGGSAV